jgi:hypothetical protein
MLSYFFPLPTYNLKMSQKAYFLVPSIDYAPDQLIKIGQIITSLKTPHMAIAPPIPLEPPTVYSSYQLNWEDERRRSISGSIGIWTKFLSIILGIVADVAGNIERNDSTVWKFERLETSFIVPDIKFVNENMESVEVKKFFEENPKKAAYMITGVKIARGAALARKSGRVLGGDGKVGVDGTGAGVPISAGPKVSFKRETVEAESFTGSSDFVFAYRLIKIYKHPKTSGVTIKEKVKGALYKYGSDGTDGSSQETASQEIPAGQDLKPQEFEIEGFDKEDVGLSSTPPVFERASVRDGDVEDETCEVIWLKEEAV